MQSTVIRLALGLLVVTAFCGMSARTQAQEGDDVASLEAALGGGDPINGKRGVVEIYAWLPGASATVPLPAARSVCGGVILDDHHVLTAGHCVADLLGPGRSESKLQGCYRNCECWDVCGQCTESCDYYDAIYPKLQGQAEIVVDYFAGPGTTPRRISDPKGPVAMTIAVYPKYSAEFGSGTADPSNDLAIIRFDGGTWLDSVTGGPLAAADAVNLRTGDCAGLDPVVFYGRGPVNDANEGSSMLRTMSVDLTRCEDQYFTFNSPSGKAICKGDSGGAYMVHDENGVAMLVGIQSGSLGIDSPDICQESNEFNLAVRLDTRHIDWIRTTLGKACNTVMVAAPHAAINCF